MSAEPPPYPLQVKDISPAEYRYLVETPYVWDDMLIDTNKLANIHVENLSPVCPSGYALASLGQFDNLSTEVICTILNNLDLYSLMRLKVTNSRFKCVITGWEPFGELVTGAPDVLRALLATNAAVMFTVPQISKAVFTTRCEFCGECGTFLQLLKLARCCFRCLATDRRLLSVPLSFAQITMGLNPNSLPKIPHLTTVPRAKFWGTHQHMPSYCAVDYTTALKFTRPYPVRKVGSELEPYLPELSTIIRRRCQKTRAINQRRSGAIKRCCQSPVARPLSSYPITTIRPLVSEIDINPLENETFRFLSAIHAPGRSKTSMFDPRTETYTMHQSVENHGYCSGCRFAWNLISPRHPMEHTIFTKPELDAHLQNCFYARIRWDQLYPADRPVDEARAVQLLKQHRPPLMLRNGTPGCFETIPTAALSLYAKSNLIDDEQYGDLLLGSCDATSQASWATSGRNTAASLWRYINPVVERKGRKGGDLSSWKQAATLQLRRPRMGQRVLCQNGLPTSSNLHPDHTEVYHLNGQDVPLWFESENTAYPQPWFLDNLSQ